MTTPPVGRPAEAGWRSWSREWPFFTSVALLVLAMVVLLSGHWRRGAFGVGIAVLAAGLFRALLPEEKAGVLSVRGKLFDSIVLLGTAGVMLGLTMIVPHSRLSG